MLEGKSPFFDENDKKMLDMIANSPVSFSSNFDKNSKDLISRFLTRNPLVRLGSRSGDVSKIKAHPFFKDIDWEKLENREVEAFWKPNLSSETDTRYVDPEFFEYGAYSSSLIGTPTQSQKKGRFSQFSFDFRVRTEESTGIK